MKLLYVDCSSGIAGNMFIGALLDAGMPFSLLKEEIGKMGLSGYHLTLQKVVKQGVDATYFDVEVDEAAQSERHLAEIVQIIDESDLAVAVKSISKEIFTLLGKAEAVAHQVPLEKVHFHEVGAVDSIIDIVGAAVGMEWLKPGKIICSPINVGSGTVTFSHGTIPVPVPAVQELLKGKPIYSKGSTELTTPTGAALVAALVKEFGQMPKMRITRQGYGAGKKELEFPNVLRITIGEDDGD